MIDVKQLTKIMKLFCWHNWVVTNRTRGIKNTKFNGSIIIEITTLYNCLKCGKIKKVKSEE